LRLLATRHCFTEGSMRFRLLSDNLSFMAQLNRTFLPTTVLVCGSSPVIQLPAL
jgi:hypothetical protein